jgi:hypothetical protein
MNASTERIRYDANVCGGNFFHVRERFDTWKRESPACRPERRRFGGKDAMREPDDPVHDGPERAQRVLVAECAPSDRLAFARAAWVTAEGRDVAGDGRLRGLSTRPRAGPSGRRGAHAAAAGTPLAHDCRSIERRAPSRRRDMNTPFTLHRPEPTTPDVDPDPMPGHDDPVDPPVPDGLPQGDPPSHPPPMRMPGGSGGPRPAARTLKRRTIMDIHVQSPDKRAIAQVLGRYFESRSLRYHIEELPGGVLQIGFRASGRPAAVTVSFDDAAYDTYTHWDASQKQLALGRLADGFSRMMSTRSPAALAGDYHVERF